jgi:L-2-hydroxyglutarate oxidase LhgO
VDYGQVARAYARRFREAGGSLFFDHAVTAVRRAGDGTIIVETDKGALSGASLINCAGLFADKVAMASGLAPPCRIVPFRGEYWALKPERRFLVKNLIYPVPDPRFPFLGVHFTRKLGGEIEAGPNAVLAWRREGYRRSDVSLPELIEILAYPGFWRMVGRYWQAGLGEMIRSFSKSRYATALREFVPEVRSEDLSAGGAGVRAQALGPDGALSDDFVILRGEKMVHVLNAPSPAATSSLAIAEHIAKIAEGV